MKDNNKTAHQLQYESAQRSCADQQGATARESAHGLPFSHLDLRLGRDLVLHEAHLPHTLTFHVVLFLCTLSPPPLRYSLLRQRQTGKSHVLNLALVRHRTVDTRTILMSRKPIDFCRPAKEGALLFD
ncbi:hypothetical protein VTI28DRAFT_6388 [Corynascus sepedonium]